MLMKPLTLLYTITEPPPLKPGSPTSVQTQTLVFPQTLQIADPPLHPIRAISTPTTAFVTGLITRRKMPWPWQSGSSSNNKADEDKSSILPNSFGIPSRTTNQPVSWNDSLNIKDWDQYKDPRTWIPAFAVTTVFFCGLKFYRTYLRRIPSVEYIHPELYRKRRLFGKVTSVGDGDGFHLFHTPGGKWAGWGWLRTIPSERKELRGKTVRLASCISCAS